jgi:hypothetical protein
VEPQPSRLTNSLDYSNAQLTEVQKMSIQHSSMKEYTSQRRRFLRLSRNIPFVLLIIVATTTTAGSSCSKLKNKSSKNVAPLDATLDFCDLVRKPDDYDSKTVRVRSVLIGFHELALFGAGCESQTKYIRADFDPKTRRQLVQGVSDLGDSGKQHGNFWVTVVAVGRFERIPESDCHKLLRESGLPNRYYPNYCFRIAIQDVQDVEPVPAKVALPQ